MYYYFFPCSFGFSYSLAAKMRNTRSVCLLELKNQQNRASLAAGLFFLLLSLVVFATLLLGRCLTFPFLLHFSIFPFLRVARHFPIGLGICNLELAWKKLKSRFISRLNYFFFIIYLSLFFSDVPASHFFFLTHTHAQYHQLTRFCRIIIYSFARLFAV